MNTTSNEERFDAIVIGSGIGGLAFAAIVSRLAGWRVVVLERHFRAGGFTHVFERPGGLAWDVGLHYVGEMAPGSTMRRVFDYVTGGAVRWNPMPDDYDRFEYPGLTVAARRGETAYRDELTRAFPQERRAIARYFRDLRRASRFLMAKIAAESAPRAVGALIRLVSRRNERLALGTTGEYLAQNIADPKLRAVLASQWGDYGLPPARSAFAIHAVIALHYLDGAYYPDGGSGRIAEGAGEVIRAAGGDILVNHEVARILVEDGRAVGVEALRKRGKTPEAVRFLAPVVVSNAGAWTTFRRLLPRSVDVPFAADLDGDAKQASSFVTAYIGFNRDPRELGFQGENYWIFDGFDHDEAFARSADLLEGRPPMVYLSFPSLKHGAGAGRHTAEIIAPLDYETVERFRDEPWRRRGEEYEALKGRMAEALIAAVERRHPGFAELVDFVEVSTPLTIEHFTAHRRGAPYGIAATPERFRRPWMTPKTFVPGLYLTGADAGAHGIVGAMMGGVSAAALQLGAFGFFRVMAAAARAESAVERVTAGAPATT